MNEVAVAVFDQTSDYTELRLSTSAGTATRGMNKAVVTELVDTVEAVYRRDAVAQRVFGTAQLRELGEALFGFLDGDERWLTPVLGDRRGTTLRISAEHGLRHLPWELACVDGVPLSVREPAAVLAVRAVRAGATLGEVAEGNRPLRVLFMATSPEGVEPVLNFEAEEAGILAATADTGTELVVEESGTLEGLRFTAESYGAGYFDVLHLSGHADVPGGQPRFLVENELGGMVLASAGDIARALDGQWPRLVFVSGCWTGAAPDEGAVASMSESLVDAGAPVVLGWALPVGDVAASTFAAHLYQDLAAGRRVDRAVITARRALYAEQNRNWHLLRVYADASPLTPMVTPRHTPGRATIQVRLAATQFLDPATQVSRVASRAEFVGRRRVIQRCLRTLKQPLDTPGSAEALVLQGMGGLGKSTLASRLLERMPTYQRVVWYGRVDEARLRELVRKIAFPSLDTEIEAAGILGTPNVDLARRLAYLLRGPLGAIPCLFVFDDFEQGNLDERGDRHVLSSEMAQILPALLAAIRQSNSPSRVIITSRYTVPTPTGAGMTTEALETFTEAEQTKKITNLPHLRPEASTPGDIKARAIEAAAGNPRLLDWLDKIVSVADVDVEELLTAIEAKAVEFRESIFAERLLTSQPVEVRTMLARVNVVDLPVPAVTVHALHTHPQAEAHIRRAADLGLLEEGTDPDTGERRYFVSNVLRPLLRPLLSDEQYRHACAAAARSLYDRWFPTPNPDSDDQP